MLKQLKISNLAVIESAEFDFGRGFCVLTGETGAGKSLVVHGIELLLGGRADSGKVRTGEKEAVVEGVFSDGGRDVSIRRKISENGRSSAWIDDSPVNMTELKDSTAKFADLLGQHEHQILLDPETHIHFLDIYGGHRTLAEAYREDFRMLDAHRAKLKRMHSKIEEAENRARLREYELKELEAANLDLDEWEELNMTMRRIESAETILENASGAHEALSEGECNAITNVVSAQKMVEDIADVVPECADIAEMLETAVVALQEAARELSGIAETVDIDPEEAEQMRRRQMALQRLCRKYSREMAPLIEYLDELQSQSDEVEKLRAEAVAIEDAIEIEAKKLAKTAEELSMLRQSAAPEIAGEIARVLAPLSMDCVRFEVKFTRKPSLQGPAQLFGERYDLLPTGIETAEFYISTNPGESLRPLAAIVSGGELSRIMLALKTLFIDQEESGLLVFDEVDTGIGGDIGRHVGRALVNLAKSKQLLVITHLPQIARLSDRHYIIEKFESGGRTRVRAQEITGSRREEELERMHGWETRPSIQNG